MLNNPKDPLIGSAPKPGLELFKRFSQEADRGAFSVEHVIDAASNMLINAFRQAYADRSKAEAQFDERFGKLKSLLLNHYDSVTGKRRSTFAFDQTILVPHLNLKKSG